MWLDSTLTFGVAPHFAEIFFDFLLLFLLLFIFPNLRVGNLLDLVF